MPVHFQHLDDLQDPHLMKSALNAALRIKGKSRGRYRFNPKCLAFGGPLLVVAGPGMPIAAEVKKVLGSGTVKGKYYRDSKGRMVFETNKSVSPGSMAESIRAFFLANNSNLALEDIRILTPAKRKEIARRKKARAARRAAENLSLIHI